jgi:hypothetical protein
MSSNRSKEEFFLNKIKDGVLVEKNGKVFNTITKHFYEKPKTHRPHQVTLYNRQFKNRVAVTSVARVIWMIRNKTLVPENTSIYRRSNGELKTVPYDHSKRDHISNKGATRKISEEDSRKALLKFISSIPKITSIEKFCEDENIKFHTFYRDLCLINDLSSVSSETKHVVEGVMKYYMNTKALKSVNMDFKDVHKMRLEYAKKPRRVSQFAKDKNISTYVADKILNNKAHFIEGYIEDDVANAKEVFYNNILLEKKRVAEEIRREYISNPRNVGEFSHDMKTKYGICEYAVLEILNNKHKLHKNETLAKKCVSVKNEYYSKKRTYKSRNNGRNI